MSEVAKSMKEPQKSSEIELDKGVINTALDKDGKYEDKGILIHSWEGEEGVEFFLGKIELNNTKYLGVLNNRFQRENLGLYSYENGEKYFGWFNENNRDRHGIYFWPSKKVGDKNETELYFGFWRNNQKSDHGIYLWVTEKENNDSFDEADLDIYIGKIVDDNYSKGAYLTKKGDNFYLYYGGFKADGTKSDDNAYYYSAACDRLILGSIENNLFKNGHIAFFDDQGVLNNLVYSSFNDDGSISGIRNEDSLDEEKIKQLKNDMTLFRAVILEKDYFGDIYAKYKEITDYVNKEITSIDVYNDKEMFPNLLHLCASYNELNLAGFIERKAFNKSS